MNIFQKIFILLTLAFVGTTAYGQVKFTPKVVVTSTEVTVDLTGMPVADTFDLYRDLGMLVYASGPGYVSRKYPGHNHFVILVSDSLPKGVEVNDDANWGRGIEKSLFVGDNSVTLEVPARAVGNFGASSGFSYICTSAGRIDIWHAMSGYISTTSNMQGSHSFKICYETNAGPEACNSEAGLPVEYNYFEGYVFNGDSIVLNWETSQEINSDFFVIERVISADSFVSVGMVHAAGTSAEANRYSWSIKDHPAGLHYYRLKQVDQDGTFARTKTIAVTVRQVRAADKVVVAGSGSGNPQFLIQDLGGNTSRVHVGDLWGKTVSLNEAAPGVYWVRNHGGEATKFVKR